MEAIVFDTETTGFKAPKIVEACWLEIKISELQFNPLLRINDDESLYSETLNKRFNPNQEIEVGAFKVHGISNNDLKDCPPSESFALPEGVKYVIGHNVDYDLRVIGNPPVKPICTMWLSRMAYPKLAKHTQDAMIRFLHCEKEANELLTEHHSAMNDVNNCYRIIVHLAEKLFGDSDFTFEDLYKKSEEARKCNERRKK